MNRFKLSQFNNAISNNNSYLIYNSLSGELVKINQELVTDLENIESNSSINLNDERFKYLFDKGFIVNQDTDEFSRVEILKNQLIFSEYGERVSFVIALTTMCNLKCLYCYENGVPVHTMTNTTAADVCSFIKDRLDNNKLVKELNITWFGGEPLLNIEQIQNIGNFVKLYCNNNNIQLSTNIITNGLLLTKYNIRILQEFNLKNMQISMDGYVDFYNKYKNVGVLELKNLIQTISNICDKIHITIRLNSSKDNIESIKKLCKTLYEIEPIRNNVKISIAQIISEKVNSLNNKEFSETKLALLKYINDIGWKNQIDNFVPVPKTIPCGLMQATNFVIDPMGYLYKCEHYIGQPEYSIGDVKKGVTYPSFYAEFINVPLKKECNSCSIYPVCRGGCTQRRYEKETSVNCEEKKKEVLDILNLYYNNYLLK